MDWDGFWENCLAYFTVITNSDTGAYCKSSRPMTVAVAKHTNLEWVDCKS